MNAVLELGIEGVGVWSPELPDWRSAQGILVENAQIAANSTARPAATALSPAERRRTPESVLLGVEAAQQACVMARRDPREVAHVFASAYGELAINDYLCATLAAAPNEVSPTKFHNSVHNAPAGYWAIASGCMQASTAMSAGAMTFGAGLLEAAVRACTDAAPVLFVACDVAAAGPLRDVVASRSRFAVALVLAPLASRACARLRLCVVREAAMLANKSPLLHANHIGNPAADSLPLLAALAKGDAATLSLAAGENLNLEMEISPWLI